MLAPLDKFLEDGIIDIGDRNLRAHSLLTKILHHVLDENRLLSIDIQE